MTQPRYSICITELATEMPRCFSISIQSEVACRALLRALTVPAIWIAPENSSSFSVSVVLPASGWEMMAKVLRRATSCAISGWLIGCAATLNRGRDCIVRHDVGHDQGDEQPRAFPRMAGVEAEIRDRR